jgi:hypothetical protein
VNTREKISTHRVLQLSKLADCWPTRWPTRRHEIVLHDQNGRAESRSYFVDSPTDQAGLQTAMFDYAHRNDIGTDEIDVTHGEAP